MSDEKRQMRGFYLIWFGQLLSIMSTGITEFAMGMWVIKQTASVMDFAMVMVLSTAPGVLLTPVIGPLVDRHNRKTLIILANLAVAVTTAMVAYLYWIGVLQLWHVYVVATVDSIAMAFLLPSFRAAYTLLVPKERLGKVAGLNSLSGAVAMIAGPGLAGVLMGWIGLFGILVMDLFSYLIAVLFMTIVAIPQPKRPASDTAKDAKPSMLAEAKQGWDYIVQRQGLKLMLIFMAVVKFVSGMAVVSAMPLVLSLATEAQAGLIMSAGGVGTLIGGLYLALAGGPKRKANGLIYGGFCGALCLLLTAIQPNLWLIALGILSFNATIPVIFGSDQVIWQHKVDPTMQGRVFAISGSLSKVAFPLGSLVAAMLSDHLYRPLLAGGSAIAQEVTQLIGSGAGREIALTLITGALVLAILAIWGRQQRQLYRVEQILPDVLKS